MAKAKGASNNIKQTFGKRKGGRAQKSSGPRDKSVSKYRGQGR